MTLPALRETTGLPADQRLRAELLHLWTLSLTRAAPNSGLITRSTEVLTPETDEEHFQKQTIREVFTLRAGDGASHPVSPGVRVTAIAAFSRYLEEEQRSFLLSAAEAAPLLTALNREADLQLTLELAPPLGEASLIPPRLRLLLTPPD